MELKLWRRAAQLCAIGLLGMHSMAQAQSPAYCDAYEGTEWVRYGQNLLAHRCVIDEDLPTANSASTLMQAWEAPAQGSTSAPILDANAAYFGDHANNFYAVHRATGRLKWQVNLMNPNSYFEAIRGSAAVNGNHVYVATSTLLYKLDKDTGAIQWSTRVDPHFATNVDSSPIVVGNLVIIGVASWELFVPLPFPRSFAGAIVAFDTATGQLVWRRRTTTVDANGGAGVGVWGSVAVDVARNMLFIGTGNAYEPPAAPLSDSLLALDLSTGNIIWSQQYVAGDIYSRFPPGPGPDADIGASPNLFTLNGEDVVGVGNKSGLYRIFKRADGTPIRTIQLPTAPTAYVGGIMGSAAVANGIIYVNSNSWFTYQFIDTGVNNPQDTSITYAIDAATGNVLWSTQMTAPHVGGLTKVNDVIYHTLVDGKIVGLNAATGAIVFQDTLPGAAGGAVTASKGRLHVAYGFNFGTTPVAVSGIRTYKIAE